MVKYYLQIVFLFMINSTTAQDQVSAIAAATFHIKKDRIVWDKKEVFGYRNIATQDTFNMETMIRVASISKMITSIAFMQLVEQGRVSLDDDISKYLGFSFPHKITPRMLLSHTSGLADGKYYGDFLDATYNSDTIPYLSELFLRTGKFYDTTMFHHGGREYANINFGIIGTLIEKITNQRFDVYMQKEIFAPLKIKASYNFLDIVDEPNRAMPYRYDQGWQPQTDIKPPASTNLNSYIIGSNAVRLGPHGGLRISVTDLAVLTALLMNDGKIQGVRLLQPATVRLMKKNQWAGDEPIHSDNLFFKNYALGIQSHKIGRQKYYGHSGEAYGLVSGAYFSKKQGFVYIISGSKDGYLTQYTFADQEEELLSRLGIMKSRSTILSYKNDHFISQKAGRITVYNSGKEIFKSEIEANTPVHLPLAIDDTYRIELVTKGKTYQLTLQK